MDITLTTDERSNQTLNIAALKEAAYQGLLDIERNQSQELFQLIIPITVMGITILK